MTIDGSNHVISVPGTLKTFGEVINLLNTQLSGHPFSISDNKLTVSSSTSGATSAVILSGTAFTSLKYFDGFDSPVNGINAIPASTYHANVVINGSTYNLTISGTIQTIGKLVEFMNLNLPGQPVEITDDFTIRVTSPAIGSTSTVQLSGDAFTTLPTFDGFGSSVDGTDAISAIAPLPYHGAHFETFTGQTFTWTIPSFGLTLTVVSGVSGQFSTESILKFIVQNLSGNVSLFDAAEAELIVPISDSENLITDPTKFSNDIDDPQYAVNNGVGWRAWSVPTQAQLDADSRVPNSSWYPYAGDYTPIVASIDIIQDAATSKPFVLNNGTTISRYSTIWTDWTELSNTFIRKVQNLDVDSFGKDQPISVEVPSGTVSSQISVYVNGVAQFIGTYSLTGTTLTLSEVKKGSEVVVVVRAYTPSSEDLAFDPVTADDLLVQRHYKIDYQYVEIPVRGEDGSISTTKYYFWVKNRSVPARKKNLSVKAITQLLTTGPSQYLTFQNIQEAQ